MSRPSLGTHAMARRSLCKLPPQHIWRRTGQKRKQRTIRPLRIIRVTNGSYKAGKSIA